jgi:hypothetical protein
MGSPLWLAPCLLLASCASAALPAEEGDLPAPSEAGPFSRSGVYVEASRLLGREVLDEELGGADLGSLATGGWGARVGYRAKPGFAVEAAFRRVSFDDEDVHGGWWDLASEGKFFLAEERFQPYLLLGMGGIVPLQGNRDPGLLLRVALGADLYATPEVGLFAEAGVDVQRFWNPDLTRNTEKDHHLSIEAGVIVRF